MAKDAGGGLAGPGAAQGLRSREKFSIRQIPCVKSDAEMGAVFAIELGVGARPSVRLPPAGTRRSNDLRTAPARSSGRNRQRTRAGTPLWP